MHKGYTGGGGGAEYSTQDNSKRAIGGIMPGEAEGDDEDLRSVDSYISDGKQSPSRKTGGQ
jgi:hypothetical protein